MFPCVPGMPVSLHISLAMHVFHKTGSVKCVSLLQLRLPATGCNSTEVEISKMTYKQTHPQLLSYLQELKFQANIQINKSTPTYVLLIKLVANHAKCIYYAYACVHKKHMSLRYF